MRFAKHLTCYLAVDRVSEPGPAEKAAAVLPATSKRLPDTRIGRHSGYSENGEF